MLVAYSHCSTFYVDRVDSEIYSKCGSEGVTLFFVISGFIMIFTSFTQRQNFLEFIRNRITRVVPLYWAITLAVFAIAFIRPTLLKSTHADILELLKSLAFIPFVKESGVVQPIVFVGWTLNYEMFFYTLFAFGLLANSRIFGAISILAALCLLVLLGNFVPPTMVVTHFLSRPILLEFGLGMGLGLLWLSDPPWTVPSIASSLILIASISLIVVTPTVILLTANAGYGIASGAIVGAALLLERNGIRLHWRWLQRTGDASYSIYLTHFFVTLSVEHLVRLVQPGPLGTSGFVLIALTLCALTGFACHRLIEQPLTRVAKRLWSAPNLLPTAS